MCPQKSGWALGITAYYLPPWGFLQKPLGTPARLSNNKSRPDKSDRLCYSSGWADLNRRPQVPQTCTLNPCATARLSKMLGENITGAHLCQDWLFSVFLNRLLQHLPV